MTPIYLNPPPSPFPQPVEKEAYDQVFDHHHHLLFTSSTTTTTTSSPTSQASSSSLTFPIFFNPTQDQGGINYDHIDQEQEVNKYLFHGGSSSSDLHQFLPIPSHDPTSSVLLPTVESTDHHHEVSNNNYGGLQFSIMSCKQEEMIIKAESCQIENGSSSSSVKWMSSKMRLMRKMMNPDQPRIVVESSTTQKFQQDQHQHQPISPNSNNNSTIRVCSDCNTTKTPLWRSGPRGPKSLCNACGIRQRKARRAMAAAAAAANGTILASTTTDHTSSSMRTTTNNKGQQQYKKRCKITAPRSRKKICFEDLTINLNKNSAFQRVFPQDEKEAAILLMALSCGLVHG